LIIEPKVIVQRSVATAQIVQMLKRATYLKSICGRIQVISQFYRSKVVVALFHYLALVQRCQSQFRSAAKQAAVGIVKYFENRMFNKYIDGS